MTRRYCVLCGLVLLGLVDCSSSSSAPAGELTFAVTIYTSVMSDKGDLKVDVRLPPDEPTRGTNAAELTVLSTTTNATVDGLTVTVVPWMPAMGHGASVKPTVTAKPGGVYVVTGLSLFMPGTWELRTDLAGGSTDRVVAIIQVP